MKREPQTLEEIRLAGLRALRRELGPVGMVRFLQQFTLGSGDYSRQRGEWLDSWTLEDIAQDIEHRRQSAPANGQQDEPPATP
jgi:hypothetical protein